MSEIDRIQSLPPTVHVGKVAEGKRDRGRDDTSEEGSKEPRRDTLDLHGDGGDPLTPEPVSDDDDCQHFDIAV